MIKILGPFFYPGSQMERITDKFDDEIQHIAMKTGLKTWHVIAALVGKLPY